MARLLALVVLFAGVAALPAAPAGAASQRLESILEQQFILQLNQERAARGIGDLTVNADLTAASRRWSDQMGSSNTLYHSSDGRAEIVGYGYNSGQITRAFMNSAGHRHIIVDPNLAYAGAGVSCVDDRLWITVQFLRRDTSKPILSSSSSSPVATSDSEGSSCGDSANIGNVRRLYAAYFRRESDTSGLNHWVSERDRGVALEAISAHFAGSQEFRSTYGDLTDRQFVSLVYQNVLGRQPDEAGYRYWLDRLATDLDRGGLMVGFSESPEFIRRTGIA